MRDLLSLTRVSNDRGALNLTHDDARTWRAPRPARWQSTVMFTHTSPPTARRPRVRYRGVCTRQVHAGHKSNRVGRSVKVSSSGACARLSPGSASQSRERDHSLSYHSRRFISTDRVNHARPSSPWGLLIVLRGAKWDISFGVQGFFTPGFFSGLRRYDVGHDGGLIFLMTMTGWVVVRPLES